MSTQAWGLRWRKKVVQELAWQKCSIDPSVLRKVLLFPVTSEEPKREPRWAACGEEHIFWSLPANAPKGLLCVVDFAQGCQEDRELLSIMGCGQDAQPRDVAYAIVQQNLGLSTVEDLASFDRFAVKLLGMSWCLLVLA